jgi:peptide/nickel transport system substrate-binding protein
MGMKGLLKRSFTAVMAAGALTAGLAVVSPAATSGAATPNTVTWAEAASGTPNYIFPFMSLAYFSVANISQFQYIMYRPLYWFGLGSSPALNPSLSLAQVPTYSNSNSTVTINLKSYKWSNGESVTTQDVMFFLNMLHAQKANWAAYAPGGASIPDALKSVTINSPTQMTLQLTGPFNSQWFTYNQLGQITPFPVAWDKTSASAASGSGKCSSAAYGTADTACTAVYTFLSNESGYNPANPKAANNALPTYATNPLWQVVDGPYHLTAFDATGNVTMQINPTYSGPVKPTIETFKELPFTTETAEFNALVGGQVNYGYLPTVDITKNGSPTKSGPNNPRLAANFNLYPQQGWAINYFPYNFNSTGDGGNAGAIFSQLYFRQAVQYLVDQPAYINSFGKGYGVGTYGPVPVLPSNPFASSYEKNNPYPYNPSKAKSLLTSHGWKVVPGGTSTCTKPGTGSGECGKGIPAGAKLAFTLQYASGTAIVANTMNAEKSSWGSAGINVTLTTGTFDSVIGNAVPCSGASGCGWELENWGAGWIFSPDYYPSGEAIFQTGAGSNSGSYTDATNDNLIKATNFKNVTLTAYENYLAKQLPVIYQPNFANPINEIQKTLKGATPLNAILNLTPENWRFTK